MACLISIITPSLIYPCSISCLRGSRWNLFLSLVWSASLLLIGTFGSDSEQERWSKENVICYYHLGIMYKKGRPLNLLTWLKGGYLKNMSAISGGLEKIWNKKQCLLHSPLQLKLWLVPYGRDLESSSFNFCLQLVDVWSDQHWFM